MTRLTLRATGPGGIPVRGLIARPGEFTPHVNGRAMRLTLPPDVLEAAFEDLRARLAAGEEVPMHLMHPDLGGFPLRWGRIRGVARRPEDGGVYLTDTEPLPEILRVMTPEAWQQVRDLGLSMDGDLHLNRTSPTSAVIRRLRITGTSIVPQGAMPGSQITSLLPAGLAARIAAQQAAPGGCGEAAEEERDSAMPKLETVADIPAETREGLTPEQQEAYLAAYNAALEAGETPEEAHQTALNEARKVAKAAGEDAETEETEEKNMKAEMAELRAQADRASKLDEEVKTLRAQLATKTNETKTTTERLTALQGDLKRVTEEVATMRAEKARMEAEADVEGVIRAGRAVPAERESLVKYRQAIGAKEFVAAMSARPILVKPGEMGAASGSKTRATQTEEAQKRAQGFVDRLGVHGVLAAGLHRGADGEAIKAVLAAQHADDPVVAKALGGELKRLQAKAAGGDS